VDKQGRQSAATPGGGALRGKSGTSIDPVQKSWGTEQYRQTNVNRVRWGKREGGWGLAKAHNGTPPPPTERLGKIIIAPGPGAKRRPKVLTEQAEGPL